MPIIDMLDVTARGLRERGLARIPLFVTRFTIETAFFGALDAFDVVSPRPEEIEEIHRVYLELATAGHTSAAGSRRYATSLRQSADTNKSTLSSWRGPTST